MSEESTFVVKDGEHPSINGNPGDSRNRLQETGEWPGGFMGLRGRLFHWLEKERAHSEGIMSPGAARDISHRFRPPYWLLLCGLLLILGVASAKPYLPPPREHTLDEFWLEILPLFVAEMGVALLVAFFVALGIDMRAKRLEARQRAEDAIREEERRESERVEALSREQRLVSDVFRGVLGIQHSAAYVRKVIETTLDQKIVRRWVSIIYTLREFEPAPEDAQTEPGRFLILEQCVSFSFENLSSTKQKTPLRFAIPVRHGKFLRRESYLSHVKIGDVEHRMPAEKQDAGATDAKVYEWPIELEPHAKLAVTAQSRVIKEVSDTEVWSSYFPCTEGMSLQVVGPATLHMGIRNNTASKDHVTEKDPEGTGIGVWKIDGAILPNDSVVFYWRTPEDDGDAEDDLAPRPGPGKLPIDGTGAPLPSPGGGGSAALTGTSGGPEPSSDGKKSQPKSA